MKENTYELNLEKIFNRYRASFSHNTKLLITYLFCLHKNATSTTHIIVLMWLEIELLRQREDLIVLLQECLAIFQLVEIIGL